MSLLRSAREKRRDTKCGTIFAIVAVGLGIIVGGMVYVVGKTIETVGSLSESKQINIYRFFKFLKK